MYCKRFGDQRPQRHPQPPERRSIPPEATLATEVAPDRRRATSCARRGGPGTGWRMMNWILKRSHEMEELERNRSVSDGEIEEQNQAMLKRWQTSARPHRQSLRHCAGSKWAKLCCRLGGRATQEGSATFSSFASSRCRSLHECNDVDLRCGSAILPTCTNSSGRLRGRSMSGRPHIHHPASRITRWTFF